MDRFALGKVSRNGFLSLDYIFSKVAKNRDLHRIKARGLFGNLLFPVSVSCNHSNKTA